MPLSTIIFLCGAVFVTAMLSGVFGMAGGMVLMVLLLAVLPVQAAMALHASVQLISNGWRCFLWRRHIVWGVIPPYLAGMMAGLCVVALVRFVPDRATALLVLGSVPLVALGLERWVRLSILDKSQTFATAACLTFVQMTAGVVGPLLDLLYNSAPLARKQIVATKAFTQGCMHVVRLLYFGVIVPIMVDGRLAMPDISPWIFIAFAALSVAGTSAAALVLHRISDDVFKKASRVLILMISLYCIGQGIILMARG